MWQVPEIARIIGEFGYNVDVIDYDDQSIKLSKRYHLLLDIYPQNHKVYDSNLADECIKVLYSTGSAPTWQNAKENERLDDLWNRRQVKLPAKAYAAPFGAEIESFDAMFVIGNQHTLSTYGELPIKLCFLIKNSAYLFPDTDLAKKSPATFLFLATYPQVLKGLDLLLEVFAQNQDLNLIVCSQFNQEKDFCAVYDKELFHSRNIVPVGPVDITGSLFKKIAELCAYVIMPSCSEGMSGSVLTAMSAGLIPIVSRECGLEDDEVYYLPQCNVSCIAETVRGFSRKQPVWLNPQALKAQQIVRLRYSPEQFSISFKKALQNVFDVKKGIDHDYFGNDNRAGK
ncbi:MAG TPA: glycosyltransferase family 4 protein [Ruminiclostridium sp.]|nr:glycosyltransferase family 4 protein [Ruminiclostridium sp.]